MKKIIKKAIVILPLIAISGGLFFSKVHSQDNTTSPVSGTTNTSASISSTVTTSEVAPNSGTISTPNDPTTSSSSVTIDSEPDSNLSRTEIKTDTAQISTSSKQAISTSNKPIIKIETNPDFVVFTVKTREAKRVECYAEREGVGNPHFLGAANKVQEEIWELKADIRNKIPNGTYTGYAKIIDGEGTYRTEKVEFSVNRSVAENISNPTTFSAQIQNEQNNTEKNQKQAENKIITNQPASIANSISNIENDFDQDGISNYEEKRLGTNPLQADTDQDGYLDGDELKNGFDPLKFSPGNKSDKIIFQNPKEKGQVDKTYAVENIEMKKDPEKGNAFKLSGKALPNIYLTIYIYSEDPIVVTVKTDENGNWVYDLEKDLENGDHEVYVAMTDNTGKITAKSSPFRFVKTAEAVTITKNSEGAALVQSPIGKAGNNALLYAIIIVTFFLGMSLALIGFVTTHKKEKNEGAN
jgi:hypothetical protein